MFVRPNNIIKSEKIVTADGEVKYLDTIERNPQELINVWNPHKNYRTREKHIKRRSDIKAKEILLQLSIYEKAFLFAVEPYLDWETNILIGDGKTAGSKNQPLKWKDLDLITGIDKRKRKQVVESLTKKNLLGYLLSENKKKGIVINPILMLNGKYPAQSLLSTFLSANDLSDDP